MLGIIGGTSLLYCTLPELSTRAVPTPYGPAEVMTGDIAVVLRHQYGRPPHRINYRAQMAALALSGVDRVITVGSVGSLKPALAPGSVVIPTDYLSLTDIPSFHDGAIEHVMPELDTGLIERLGTVLPEALTGGTYAQTRGPRIETVAEVRGLAKVADVVGMTVASEATLARELGIPVAAVCTVDNYAHGLSEEVLTYEHILATSKKYARRTEGLIETIVDELGD
ncbi:MTAP family purine nucleoside phosphorylase [Methanofollis fontis]|uniref:5'-methylthioadenosine phosphorylase n=1 Tax=Methanofollis fontis TaxID=2052832 RepID=A0A483CT09_9EURY|nr:MTAP family purine nucleoside phosphorylase [Methanofollis fontis]TAJ44463.1 5'-methylthioadenosine phosphorylase [Methanofollis fontis]